MNNTARELMYLYPEFTVEASSDFTRPGVHVHISRDGINKFVLLDLEMLMEQSNWGMKALSQCKSAIKSMRDEAKEKGLDWGEE